MSLDGVELAGRRPEKIRAAGVAIVPEGRRLLPDLSVDDNLKVATYTLTKQAAAEGRDRALELFPRLGQRLPVQARLLSGGEQQMVVLAQALVSQPKYILIDELSLGLAPVIVNQLIPVIRSLIDSGIGVLLIEQFAAVALSVATSAHVMENGVLRYSGTAAELKAQPDLLHSAYLLRGSTATTAAADQLRGASATPATDEGSLGAPPAARPGRPGPTCVTRRRVAARSGRLQRAVVRGTPVDDAAVPGGGIVPECLRSGIGVQRSLRPRRLPALQLGQRVDRRADGGPDPRAHSQVRCCRVDPGTHVSRATRSRESVSRMVSCLIMRRACRRGSARPTGFPPAAGRALAARDLGHRSTAIGARTFRWRRWHGLASRRRG